MEISLEIAEHTIRAAKKMAQEIGIPMNIAIVDNGANLLLFCRMDKAWLGSMDIAIKKAKTARFFNMETGEIGKLSQPGYPLFQVEVSNGGLISFPGGIPLKNKEGEVIAAIGVSGGSVGDDYKVAAAGADAFAKYECE
ncbi:MAG: hypothetical protein JWO06_2051 [Bacteroidota bacterium]|nr:hypothetical protein [Bacteroidota bacterium]